MLRTLKALLAVWVAVAATGSVVSHRHAADAGRAHGYGWLTLSGPADDAVETTPHRHVVLAGVEFAAIPDADRPAGPESARVDSVLKAGHTIADSAPPPLGVALVVAEPVVMPVHAWPFAAPLLCHVALHLRTGVLRS